MRFLALMEYRVKWGARSNAPLFFLSAISSLSDKVFKMDVKKNVVGIPNDIFYVAIIWADSREA